MSLKEDKKSNVQNNNNIIAKLSILKNALLEERKKSENFQQEIKRLKEEIISIQEKNNILKDENIMKQEQIEKLKEELSKFKNNKTPKKIKNFFNNLFDEKEGEKQDEEEFEALNLLKKENENLKEQITLIKNEKLFINGKLNESIKDFNELKEKYEKKIKEIEMKQNENILKYENEIQKKDKKYKKEIEEKNKFINDKLENTKYLTEYIKTFDTQKLDYENKISKINEELKIYKINLEQKEEENKLLLLDQQNLLKQVDEYQNSIQDLNCVILQYKEAISELTPITIEHLFSGFLIPSYIDEQKQNVQISFTKRKNKFYFKLENEKELVLNNKEVIDIIQDSKRKNRVKIILKINKEKKMFVCDFTQKEIEPLFKFFNEFKRKTNLIENALIGMNVDYFY